MDEAKPWLLVRCSYRYCRAVIGKPCTTKHGQVTHPHVDRVRDGAALRGRR